MTARLTFIVGSQVTGTDGHIGHLVRAIVDPMERTITHLVVEPHHVRELARLDPVGVVTAIDGDIRLSLSRAEFESLDAAEETEFLRAAVRLMGPVPGRPSNIGTTVCWVGVGRDAPEQPITFTVDSVPRGEVQFQRGHQVHATDGAVGRVRGFVVNDSADHHVAHIVTEGHFLARKEVAIPIGAVVRVDAFEAFSLSREDLEHLPEVGVDLRTLA